MTAAISANSPRPILTHLQEDELVVELIAQQATRALSDEVATWPKPGLVSHIDNGSHRDMDASVLLASIHVLNPFFAELARAGRQQAGMYPLRQIGLRAEAAMLAATGGINTHRGAIFGLGLLCAAAGATARLGTNGMLFSPTRLGRTVARRWGNEIRKGPIPLFSHGTEALRRFGTGGARAEAIGGFRSIYDVGLPALRQGRALAVAHPSAARVHVCFALIAGVDDTNLLYRGGQAGARYAADAATTFLNEGGVSASRWRDRAARVHGEFVDRNLKSRRLRRSFSDDIVCRRVGIQLSEQYRCAACLNARSGRFISMNGIVAILCSGQGGQHPGMFDLFAGCAAVEPIFAAASDLLGKDPRLLVRAAGPGLFEDRIGQILCCTQALAGWAALEGARPARAVFAGYSIGELAAWGCAGAFDPKVTLELAAQRAAAMDAAAPKDSGLAAIVGLRRPTLEPILQRHATSLAIINGIDSFVIGGHVDALIASCQEAAALGAIRTVRLRVSVPSHTPLLVQAVPQLRQALCEAAPRVPASGHRLLNGIDGRSVQDPVTGCEMLSRQIATTIDWAACLTACRGGRC